MEEDKKDLKRKGKVRYKPSKTGKIALYTIIASLSAGLLTLILNALTIVSGYFLLVVSIAAYIVAMVAMTFLMVDMIRFNKIHNINSTNESSDNKMMIGMVIGIVIGFIWGKIL